MTTITLQDMPDDILELIYSNLDIYNSSNTNIALYMLEFIFFRYKK
jgi:hypothetical protein